VEAHGRTAGTGGVQRQVTRVAQERAGRAGTGRRELAQAQQVQSRAGYADEALALQCGVG
jgi:hypothetical protein